NGAWSRLTWVEDVVRVEQLLDPVLEGQHVRSEFGAEPLAFEQTDTVLAGERAAQPQRELEHLPRRVPHPRRDRIDVGDEDRVQIAVARVRERGNGDAVACGDLG